MILIAVMTCWANQKAADAIRATWAKTVPAGMTLRFFLGKERHGFPRAARPDELFLSVPDDYRSLVHKVKTAFQWAKRQGFSHVWKCDDDVFVMPSRLGLETRDHVGHKVSRLGETFLHGGASYVISNRALGVLTDAPITTVSEDLWATQAINRAGMKSWDDPRFSYTRRVYGDPLPAIPSPENDLIAGGELHTLASGKSEMFMFQKKEN